MGKATNIQKLLDYLNCHKKATREELAEYLKVDKKTISNYVNDVNADYYHCIVSETGKYGGYKLLNYDTTVNFDVDEINAIKIANEIITKVRPEIAPEVNQITEKIEKIFLNEKLNNTKLSVDYYKAAGGLTLNTALERKKEAKIRNAIERKVSILIEYENLSKGSSERKIDPYEIISFKGGVYVSGYCHFRKEFRIFKVSRIKKIKYTENIFSKKSDYNISQILDQTVGIHLGKIVDIKLKIDAPFDTIVSEKNWLQNQKITRIDKKSIFFEGRVSEDEETIAWLLTLKDSVTILEPSSLKESYLRTVEKIYKKAFS